MKIRLVGTLEECLDAQEQLNKVFEIVEISRPYPSRGPSRLVRVYIEVRLDPERTPPTPGRAARAAPPAGHPAPRRPGATRPVADPWKAAMRARPIGPRGASRSPGAQTYRGRGAGQDVIGYHGKGSLFEFASYFSDVSEEAR